MLIKTWNVRYLNNAKEVNTISQNLADRPRQAFFCFFAFLHVLFMFYYRCNKEIGIIQCLAEEVSSGKDSKSRFR